MAKSPTTCKRSAKKSTPQCSKHTKHSKYSKKYESEDEFSSEEESYYEESEYSEAEQPEESIDSESEPITDNEEKQLEQLMKEINKLKQSIEKKKHLKKKQKANQIKKVTRKEKQSNDKIHYSNKPITKMDYFSLNRLLRLDSLSKQIDYVRKTIFPLTDGTFWVNYENEHVLLDMSKMNTSILRCVPQAVQNWFKTQYTQRYRRVVKIGEEEINEKEEWINCAPRPKFETRRPLDSFSEKTKELADRYLKYVKEIICNNSEETYQYVIKWLAGKVQMKKTKTCLILVGAEGVGKSSFYQMIKEHVLGRNNCKIVPDTVLYKEENAILQGLQIAVLEELPLYSKTDYVRVDIQLKTICTENQISIKQLYRNKESCENVTDIIITSNYDCIKAQGRRYVYLDINPARYKDYEFFNSLNEAYNDEVGEYLFNFFMEIDVKGYNYFENMPKTDNKSEALAYNIPIEYKFLKAYYILQQKDLKSSLKEVYDEYREYIYLLAKKEEHLPDHLKIHKEKILKVHSFTQKLREIGIDLSRKSSGMYLDVSYHKLKEIADKRGWLHKYDEIEFQDYMVTSKPKPKAEVKSKAKKGKVRVVDDNEDASCSSESDKKEDQNDVTDYLNNLDYGVEYGDTKLRFE